MKKGFSLPLWVAGAARSALKKLVGLPFQHYELIKIPNEKKEIKIEIHSVGLLKDNSHALGISFAKSGLDLDITQNLEIWTIVSLEKITFNSFVAALRSRLHFCDRFRTLFGNFHNSRCKCTRSGRQRLFRKGDAATMLV